MALFKTASGSLACREILADFLQTIAKQKIPPEWLSKVTTGVVFSCHIAQLMKSVSNQKTLWSHVIPMSHCMALVETHFKYEACMALSAKMVPDSSSRLS